MVHLQVLERDGLQIWRVAANILNNQSWLADNRWSCTLRVTKCQNGPQTWMDSLHKQVKLKKIGKRFRTWNVRSPYRAGLLMTVAKQISKCTLDLVGVQHIRYLEKPNKADSGNDVEMYVRNLEEFS
jgi:hypothetical protein